VSPYNFKRYNEIDQEVLNFAIDWLRCAMVETQEELKSHLLPTHLKTAVREVCGGSYSQAVGTALTYIEAGLTKPGSIPQIVWSAARKFSPENRKMILRTATSEKDNGYAVSGFQFCGRSTFGERVTEQCDDHLPIYPTSD
jgi:hypothetical protein